MRIFINKHFDFSENIFPSNEENKHRFFRLLLIKYILLYISILNVQHYPNYIITYFLIFTIAIIELLRALYFNKYPVYHSLLIVNILLTSSTLLYIQGSIYPIIFLTLGEIVYNKNLSKRYRFIIFHMIIFFVFETLSFVKFGYTTDSLLTALSTYFFTLIFMILFKSQKQDRKKIHVLNKELKQQNLRLQEYSLKIEELTLEKERTRVAQELHDSLGHYLMAISMHLDFLEKTIDSSPQKASITIEKTKAIVENSISELRKTVYELKENKIDTSFSDAIDSLIYNFSIGSSLGFNINISPLVENVNPNLKDVMYKTIKESLTNGIKHGNATYFIINVLVINNIINLTITNKGNVGKTIIMSNGLIGIKNRIEGFNGIVNFSYTHSGFKTASLIPLLNKTNT